MKNMNYNTNNYIPPFMTCSDYERPELNFIIHTQYPRMIVEVADGFDEDDVNEAKENRLLYVKVPLFDGSEDLLVLVDLIDKINIGENETFDLIYEVLIKMSLWHREEVKSLEAFKIP